MEHDIFISYSSKDRHIAENICTLLEDNNIKCWMAPRNIVPGKEWGEAIVDAISTSKIMVLVFSSASNESQQVVREVERAVNKNLIIVTFRIENILPTKSLEYFLYSTDWLDAYSNDKKTNVGKLVETISELVKSPETYKHSVFNRKHSSPIKKKKLLLITSAIVILIMIVSGSVYGINSKINNGKQKFGKTIETKKNRNLLNKNSEEKNLQNKSEVSKSGEVYEDNLKEVNNSNVEVQQATENVSSSNATNDKNESSGENLSDKEDKIKAGEYIRFGTYNGKPIIWKVINIDADGSPMVLSDKILTLKAYDGAESGAYSKTGDGTVFDVHKERSVVYTDYSPEDLIKMRGNNSWISSNIREWLNSSEKLVSYSSTPPVAASVSGGINSYNDEPGFLYNFSDAERSLIKPVTRRVIASTLEKNNVDGGEEIFSFSRANVSQALSNYDNAFYRNVQDKVFLLSVKEVMDYIQDRGWNVKTGLTPEAIDRDKSGWYKDLKGQDGGYHMWWLDTPYAYTSSDVCIVDPKGEIIYSDYAAMAGIGVRPALYFTSQKVFTSGSGSESDPYSCK